jgi:type I restriction-modification system DNA methylase subunit
VNLITAIINFFIWLFEKDEETEQEQWIRERKEYAESFEE